MVCALLRHWRKLAGIDDHLVACITVTLRTEIQKKPGVIRLYWMFLFMYRDLLIRRGYEYRERASGRVFAWSVSGS